MLVNAELISPPRSFYSFETSELHSGSDVDPEKETTNSIQQYQLLKKETREDGACVRLPSKSKSKLNKHRDLNGKIMFSLMTFTTWNIKKTFIVPYKILNKQCMHNLVRQQR